MALQLALGGFVAGCDQLRHVASLLLRQGKRRTRPASRAGEGSLSLYVGWWDDRRARRDAPLPTQDRQEVVPLRILVACACAGGTRRMDAMATFASRTLVVVITPV